MTERLNAGQYAEDETITFKIPLTVPYYTESRNFERVEGSFEHDGEFFKLAKQKLDHDTLYVVCLKDTHEKKLMTVMTDFVKLSSNLPGSAQQALKMAGNFSKDYVPATPALSIACQGWQRKFFFSDINFNLPRTEHPVLVPPPDRIS
jgi:hypothetical protein